MKHLSIALRPNCIMLIMIISLLTAFAANAQKVKAGFYKTAEDYLSGTITDAGEYVGWGRIPFAGDKVEFKKGGVNKVYHAKELDYWGFRDKDGLDFRIDKAKKTFYGIAISGSVMLYSNYISSRPDGKGGISISFAKDAIYLSKGPSGEIHGQNMGKRLKEWFADDPVISKKFNAAWIGWDSEKAISFIEQYNSRHQ
jgi:hypothetical protein